MFCLNMWTAPNNSYKVIQSNTPSCDLCSFGQPLKAVRRR